MQVMAKLAVKLEWIRLIWYKARALTECPQKALGQKGKLNLIKTHIYQHCVSGCSTYLIGGIDTMGIWRPNPERKLKWQMFLCVTC